MSESPVRETPDDWAWATFREAAINLKAIADDLGVQLALAKKNRRQYILDGLQDLIDQARKAEALET